MKQILITSLILLLIAFLLPLLAAGQPYGNKPSPEPSEADTETDAPPAPDPEVSPIAQGSSPDADTQIVLLTAGTPVPMALSDYLYGVVSAEMPALYPLDALRAQAVAARTYAMHARRNPHHPDADICDDYAHCMAYRPLEAAIEAWGAEDGTAYAEKIKEAVDSTDGEVLLYGGELIDALFFAVSSGKTENASDVWSGSAPYLQSVDSPWDSESPSYRSKVTVSHKEAREKLTEALPGIDLSAKPSKWFGKPERSPSGGIKTVTVGGMAVSGPDLRGIFGLSSHNFTIKSKKRKFIFRVKGYGHGVGLSQFGARQMALAGHDYRAILTHYYNGVEIAKNPVDS